MILKPKLFRKPRKGHWATKGLVGYWLFNEGSGNIIQDLSGNGNDGVITNATWRPGNHGSALDFVASENDNVITLPDMTSLFTDEATLIMWLKANNDPAVSGFGGAFRFGTSASKNHYPYIDGNLYVDTFRDDRFSVGDVGIDTSEWHQLAITNKPGANNWKFYQNAVEYYNNTGEATINLPIAPLIGHGSSNSWHDGAVGYAILYNRALSASEIALLYREPFVMFERDPIELWVGATSVGAPPAGIVVLRRRRESA